MKSSSKTFLKEAKRAFTLIELLTVIAVIFILLVIVVPSLRVVQKSVKKSASQARFNQWVSAIEFFRQEYGYYPWTRNTESDTILNLNNRNFGVTFVETLSGRNANGDPVTTGGNRRGLSFYTFSNKDFFYDPETDAINVNTLVDAFNNHKIMLVLDSDEDGQVVAGPDNEIVRANVAIWTLGSKPSMTVRSWK